MSAPRRVASLAPSHTDLLLQLGAGDRLAAVTSFCDLPPERAQVQRLAGWSNLKPEDVLALQPDLVLTSSVCQAGLKLALEQAGVPLLHQDPRTLADVRASFLEVGRALDLDAPAQALARRWDEAWAAIRVGVPADATPPRVYVEEWHQPPMVAGNWVPELVRLAGGEPFMVPPGGLSREVSWEEVLEFDAQMVVYTICGLATAYAPEAYLKVEGWDRTEAAVARRVYSVDDSWFNRPGMGLLTGAKLLQDLLGENFWGGPRVENAGLRCLK